jgi:hypothetical protein
MARAGMNQRDSERPVGSPAYEAEMEPGLGERIARADNSDDDW